MNGKKVCIALLMMSLLLVSVFTAGAQDSTPRIWLSSGIAQATAGQEFDMAVNVSGASGIYGGSFQVIYDTQAFEVVLDGDKAVTPGAIFGTAPSFPLKKSADPAQGTIDYALTLTQPAEPVSGDGVLGTIKFRALKDSPISIIPVKASLVSPEFTEVNGRRIAQKINQIEAQIAETALTNPAASVIEQPAPVVEQPQAAVADTQTDTATASVSVASVSVNQPLDNSVVPAHVTSAPVTSERPTNNRVLVAAGLFFFAGLVLLIISVGMYSKMRVRFSLAGDNMPEYTL
jgi:hypothetical protein